MKKSEFLFYIIIGLISILGIGLGCLIVARYEIGITSDSVDFIAAARSLLQLKGYSLWADGSHLIYVPPLFTTLIAFFALFGIEHTAGASIINITSFGIIIFLSGYLFRKALQSRFFAVIGTMVILVSFPLITACTILWTEALFTVLTIACVLLLPKFLVKKNTQALFLIGFIAAAAFFTRYVGFNLIVVFLILVGCCTPHLSLRKKLSSVFLFLVIACTPVCIWFIRNYLVSGTLTGQRTPSVTSFIYNTLSSFKTMGYWIFPFNLSYGLKIFGVILLTLFVLYKLVYYFVVYIKSKHSIEPQTIYLFSSGILLFVYVTSIIISGTITFIDDVNDRYLVPIYPYVILFFLLALKNITDKLEKVIKKKHLMTFIVTVLCTVFVATSAHQTRKYFYRQVKNGNRGYSSSIFKNSQIIKWLGENSVSDTAYTNNVQFLYLCTGLCALPLQSGITNVLNKTALKSNSVILFNLDYFNISTSDTTEFSELSNLCELKKIVSFPDGTVYEINPKINSSKVKQSSIESTVVLLKN